MTAGTREQRRYTAPPSNMVQEVRNIIEGYSMGPLRALAQDPVQNSLDARRFGADVVGVSYQLHSRSRSDVDTMLLTVTDTGTTGLRGDPLSPEALHGRGQLELRQEENWAAWEAMGYTKVGEAKLGSRGQGKSAFLYHSEHLYRGNGGSPIQRMVMLYDTLLEDGTYRLGVRLALPEDLIIHPPFEGEEAKEIIRTEWRDDELGLLVPLELDPLEEVGTRIIVPFLSQEALDAFANGEMLGWLERCWWRAIQVGDVEIAVIDETGKVARVEVPAWWRDEPWREEPPSTNVLVRENISLEGTSQRIKRIVLLHDAQLGESEIASSSPQYGGVQLLRGRQWIETLGAGRDFGDFIPQEERPGFRGFVEFDRHLEGELREVEKPQHDGFGRRRAFVGAIDRYIAQTVQDFARDQGWTEDRPQSRDADRTAQEALAKISDLFVAAGQKGQRGRKAIWQCELNAEFPDPASARIDWGGMLSGVEVECRHTPAYERRDVDLVLEVISPDGTVVELARRNKKTREGTAGADLGDYQVVHHSQDARELHCPVVGEYRLRARCIFEGQPVASASRAFFVACDPPDRATRPFGVTLTVENADSDRIRVNSGEAINVSAEIVNRTTEDAGLQVDVSFGPLLLADKESIEVAGAPLGHTPTSKRLIYSSVGVFTQAPADPHGPLFAVLEAGVHSVRVDVRDELGEVVAHASKKVYVAVDPPSGGADRPFRIEQREDGVSYPIWELEPAISTDEQWVLRYAPDHPIYKTASDGRQRGLDQFWAETISGGLVEWAIRLEQNRGDGEGFESLVGGAASSDGHPLWERYAHALEKLRSVYNDPIECLTQQREVVSLMLCLVDEV